MHKPELIDFSKIKFGTMTRMAKEHHAPSVKAFAHEVLEHPDKYSKKAVHKARFYENILTHHK